MKFTHFRCDGCTQIVERKGYKMWPWASDEPGNKVTICAACDKKMRAKKLKSVAELVKNR
jgi:uncharacterized CHY-type Zn-finger protein